MDTLILVLATGITAGLLAGLLGIGGGLVFVPALLAIYLARGVPPEVAMHLAVGSSLAAIVLTSFGSIAAHARRDNVAWPVLRLMLPGLLVGGVAGAALAAALPGDWLRRVFAVFLAVVAVQLVAGLRPAPHRTFPGAVGAGFAGGGIGTLSATLGIGGGTLSVPFLVWCNVPVLRAVGTAAAAGLPLAAAGAIGFAVAGWRVAGLPTTTIGYVDWSAGAVLGLIAMATAPAGARLAHRVSAQALRRVLGSVMLVIAVRLALP